MSIDGRWYRSIKSSIGFLMRVVRFLRSSVCARALFVTLLWSLVAPLSAHSITLDSFGDAPESGTLLSTNIPGVTRNHHFPFSGAVGGGRSLSIVKIGSAFGSTELGIYSSFVGYTQGAHAGSGTITWDGDSSPTTLNPAGLGGINLREDDGTAFKVNLLFFDSPLATQQIEMALRLYDSRFPAGNRYAEVTVAIDQGWAEPTGFPISIPFSLFETPGSATVPAPNGSTFNVVTVLGDVVPPSLEHIGAIQLIFNPRRLTTLALDLTLGSLTTNGRCSAIPAIGGSVVDECGVCIEDPGANQGKDRCNVCLTGPPGYSYQSNSVFDGCGLCPGETNYLFPTGTKDTCGECLSGAGTYAYVDRRDACGICGGTTTSPAACGTDGACSTVAPTAEIRAFERQLLDKAMVLRGRFTADMSRWKRNGCGLGFTALQKRVSQAYKRISRRGGEIFRRGIEVCGNSCVTVSYANEVAALSPQFRILEGIASRAARMVQQCYQRRGIAPSRRGNTRNTRQTIVQVRQGLDRLIADCRSKRICPRS